MTTTVCLSALPVLQFFDNSGAELAGGTLTTLVGGIAYPTWSEVTGTSQLPNPIVLNQRGEVCTAVGTTSPLYVQAGVSYTYILQDSVGNTIWTQSNITSPMTGAQVLALITQSFLGSVLYPQTTTELSQNVTPTTYAYPAGDFRRYGADPTGINSSDAALAAACSCNADVFDGAPGGGTYLFNTGFTLINFPITIRGQAKNNKDVSINSGTTFTLSSSTTGAAIITTAYADGLRVQNIGFQYTSGTHNQFCIYVNASSGAQLRSSIIESCAFIGTGIGDTNVAIQINSGTTGSQYSAFSTIRDCYFSALGSGITCTGNTTPNMIYANTFLGHTGAGNTPSGNGISIDLLSGSTAGEMKLAFNYFEGWTNGIYTNAAQQIQQVCNDYQGCTNGFNWVALPSGLINNQSIGETGVAGTYSGQTTLDGSQIQMVGRLGWLATGGAIQSTRGFQEGNGSGSNLRSSLMGYFSTPAFSAANFSSTSGTWTVVSGNVTTYSSAMIGGSILVKWSIGASTCSGSPGALTIAIPGGFFPIEQAINPCLVTNNGTSQFGLAIANTSGAVINIYTSASSGAWTNGAGNTGTSGEITIRILS